MTAKPKVRIVCLNCLHSKVLPIHESDPEGTRIIFTSVCDKCNEDGEGIRYYDLLGDEIRPIPKKKARKS